VNGTECGARRLSTGEPASEREQRHKDELRQGQHKCRERHPEIDVNHIGQYRTQNAACNSGSENALPIKLPIDSTSVTVIEACTPLASGVDIGGQRRPILFSKPRRPRYDPPR